MADLIPIVDPTGKIRPDIVPDASIVLPSTNYQDTYLISGGQVIYQSGLTFTVSAAKYFIRGVYYTSLQQDVTLTAADPGNPRIDVIAIDNAGTVVKVDGTADPNPSEPDIDPATQLKLAFVLVPAGAVTITVNTRNLYLEDAGSGGDAEWDWTASSGTWALNSTTNPRTGTKDINVTNAGNNSYIQGQIGAGAIDPNTYEYLNLYIRSKAVWPTNRVLRVRFQLNGVRKGNVLTIATGYWGFNSSLTSAYQQVSIPVSQFALPLGTQVNQIRITDSGGAIGFYLDDISLSGGGFSQTPQGITQADADARYVPVTLTAAPSSDHSVSGIQANFTAGEALVFGDVCYLNGSGEMVKADADAAASGFVVGIAAAVIASGMVGPFLLFGFVRDDTWNWTPGSILYLSTTAGGITATAPSGGSDVILPLGVATHADRMLFSPSRTIVEHV